MVQALPLYLELVSLHNSAVHMHENSYLTLCVEETHNAHTSLNCKYPVYKCMGEVHQGALS